MIKNRFNLIQTPHPEDEIKRRKREGIIIISIIFTVILLTFIETRVVNFSGDFPVSSTILMFILININLLLFLLLLFLVFRNLVKLYYDRKHKIMGAKLRTKLLAAFITLTLMPTTVLFFFSIHFISTSIAFWFNAPVEQTLENSLKVGRELYTYIEENNKFYLERVAYQIKSRRLLDSENTRDLANYLQVVQRSFNVQAIEVYTTNSERISFDISPALEKKYLIEVSPNKLQKSIKEEGTRTITETTPAGELIRTIGTVPFSATPENANAYIVITVLIPTDLSNNMASISRGFGEYQQRILLKKPIQTTYYIALSIVALLVVFCAVWFSFYLAKSITIPIMKLAEGTKRVAGGDLNFEIPSVADDEMGSLVDSFNKMTLDLRHGREQLSLSARMLKEQNIAIEESRQYMEIVLKNISAGVISIAPEGRITTINTSAENMLNMNAADIQNKTLAELQKGPHRFLAKEINEKIMGSGDGLKFALRTAIEGRPKSFAVHVNTLKNDQGQPIGQVLVFDDLTELEKAQRMIAWREVARRIAHEVKNPLTPITLSAQRLKRKYGEMINEKIFDECTSMIISHVDLIRNLVNEFAAFARFPTANPEPCDIVAIIKETIALYRDDHKDILFDLNVPDTIPLISLDRQQIKQAMINLLNNAIAAVQQGGEIRFHLAHDPILKTIRIEITDTGTGISDEDKTRLFEPYFSTKKKGMGLGLAIVSSIISDHNGMISVQDNQPKGAKFIIELPL
ncbi:MAG: PAS domain-containing protein [Proteobacteria bacterium]|nr:PAS domain-containing protein [Pseudomonadota bacterium]